MRPREGMCSAEDHAAAGQAGFTEADALWCPPQGSIPPSVPHGCGGGEGALKIARFVRAEGSAGRYRTHLSSAYATPLPFRTDCL